MHYWELANVFSWLLWRVRLLVIVILAVCAFTAALGLVSLVSPSAFEGLLSCLPTRYGAVFSSGVRIMFGIALLLAASKSRAPNTLKVLGMVFILVGLAIPIFGIDHFSATIDWWLTLGPGFFRVWGVVAILSGALMAYAVLPENKRNQR